MLFLCIGTFLAHKIKPVNNNSILLCIIIIIIGIFKQFVDKKVQQLKVKHVKEGYPPYSNNYDL